MRVYVWECVCLCCIYSCFLISFTVGCSYVLRPVEVFCGFAMYKCTFVSAHVSVCVCAPTIIKRFPCGRTYICTNMFVCKHSWVCVYFFSPKVSGESNENITPLLVILGDPVVFFVCFVSSASSITTSQRRTRMILLSYSHRRTSVLAST